MVKEHLTVQCQRLPSHSNQLMMLCSIRQGTLNLLTLPVRSKCSSPTCLLQLARRVYVFLRSQSQISNQCSPTARTTKIPLWLCMLQTLHLFKISRIACHFYGGFATDQLHMQCRLDVVSDDVDDHVMRRAILHHSNMASERSNPSVIPLSAESAYAR